MKKRIILTSIASGLLASMVLLGCAGEQSLDTSDKKSGGTNQTSEKSSEKKFVVRSVDGGSITTYTVDTDNNRTTRSVVSSNNSNEIVTRSYSYSSEGDLKEVRSTSNIAGTSVIKYSQDSNRADNKKTKKTIAVFGTRGDLDLVEVEYIYDDDGSALGVIQKDSNGNIYEKGLME